MSKIKFTVFSNGSFAHPLNTCVNFQAEIKLGNVFF